MLNNEADKNTTISYEEALHPRDKVNFDDMAMEWVIVVSNHKTQEFLQVGDPKLDRLMSINLINRQISADSKSYNDTSIGLHACRSEDFQRNDET